MIKYKTVIKREKVIDKVSCNRCGKQIIDTNSSHDFLHIDKHWGYESKKDFEQHTFDLCEDCYDEIIKNFKIPIKNKDYY